MVDTDLYEFLSDAVVSFFGHEALRRDTFFPTQLRAALDTFFKWSLGTIPRRPQLDNRVGNLCLVSCTKTGRVSRN